MKTRQFLCAGPAAAAGWSISAAVPEKYDDLGQEEYRGVIVNERYAARPDLSLSPGRLTGSKFWLARMIYRFAVITPLLWIFGSLVLSFCLLVAAFSL
jgi:hypothetical protein